MPAKILMRTNSGQYKKIGRKKSMPREPNLVFFTGHKLEFKIAKFCETSIKQ